MDNKLLYNLMLKRLIGFNAAFISLFLLFYFRIPLIIIFYLMLFIDILAIIIEMRNKTHYPIYCYIYPPFKTLFNYENYKSSIKRNKNVYYILLVPLALACFYMTFLIKNSFPNTFTGVSIDLPFIAIILLLNIQHIIRLRNVRRSD